MVGLGFSGLSQSYGDIIKASLAANRIFDVLDTPLSETVGDKLAEVHGDVEFCNITFAYSARPTATILSDFSLKIREGEVIAIAGCSGSGKSTIYALLAGLYQPNSGSILLDNNDIGTLDSGWIRRSVISVVNQEPVLFSGTIEENIRYGNPDATMEQIVEAAKEANADEFIELLPLKYLTHVGERGTQLSIGQKQRIAIARAVIKNPRILVLDEATSALDGKSEQLIQQALERIMLGRTVIIIAHRPSALKFASRVVVLENGRIQAEGSYSDLKESSASFKRILSGMV